MKTKRKTYEKDFKIMLVELAKNGQKVPQLSKDYGIAQSTINRWRREFLDKSKPCFTGRGNISLNESEKEIRQLKKKLKDAELERDILKKAVGIFSKSDSIFINS